MRRLWWLAVLGGCYSPPAYESCAIFCGTGCPAELTCDLNGRCKDPALEGDCPTDPGGGDGGLDIDAALDAPPTPQQQCDGTYLRVCVDPAPSTALTYPPGVTTINTTVNTNCTQVKAGLGDYPGICVIIAKTIAIPSGATVRGIGARPLMFYATDSLMIAGTVNVHSTRTEMFRGAGGDTGMCPGAGRGTDAATLTGGGGGGAGGSFHIAMGGAGGNGGAGGAPGGTAAVPSAPIDRPRGGCGGGAGGEAGSLSVAGGIGGGAVMFLANNLLSVEGTAVINASGAASMFAALVKNGGGGGGSGGFIGFESTTNTIVVSTSAKIFALGASGSSGGASSGGGQVGVEATGPMDVTGFPPGFNGASAGGPGGAGGGRMGEAGDAMGSGGGGGGGGGGVIGFVGPLPVSTNIKPSPQALPL